MTSIGLHNDYGEPTCMDCGKICEVTEEVDIGSYEFEMWCYCKPCDVETFHPAIKERK